MLTSEQLAKDLQFVPDERGRIPDPPTSPHRAHETTYAAVRLPGQRPRRSGSHRLRWGLPGTY